MPNTSITSPTSSIMNASRSFIVHHFHKSVVYLLAYRREREKGEQQQCQESTYRNGVENDIRNEVGYFNHRKPLNRTFTKVRPNSINKKPIKGSR